MSGYAAYGFQYHSIVINIKKGPECQYKGFYHRKMEREQCI